MLRTTNGNLRSVLEEMVEAQQNQYNSLPCQSLMEMYQIVFEIFQSEPKLWTDQETDQLVSSLRPCCTYCSLNVGYHFKMQNDKTTIKSILFFLPSSFFTCALTVVSSPFRSAPSDMCDSKCFCRALDMVNLFPHSLQTYGLSPVCVRR